MHGRQATMSPAECLVALAGRSVGRIAFTARALPAIVPVKFAMRGESVVFRTAANGDLAVACDDSVVAFGVDTLGDQPDDGWTVQLVGVARLLPSTDELRALPLGASFAPVTAAGDQYVGIAIGRLTGQRLTTLSP